VVVNNCFTLLWLSESDFGGEEAALVKPRRYQHNSTKLATWLKILLGNAPQSGIKQSQAALSQV